MCFISKSTQILIRLKNITALPDRIRNISYYKGETWGFPQWQKVLITVSSAPWLTIFFKNL